MMYHKMSRLILSPVNFTIVPLILLLTACGEQNGSETDSSPDNRSRQQTGPVDGPVRLITLDPGHFHAALVQKEMLEGVDPTVHIYAPGGPDLDLHMNRIEGFNNREENPTSWESEIYTGDDYLERMISEKPGNVVVTAGNNRRKTEYIHRSVDASLNVLSDKPMAIDREGWELLVSAFDRAEKNNVLLYDIMTERSEVTSRLLRALSQNTDVFGELQEGSADEPAIALQSVHHLYKQVAGEPLRRPPWYFDVTQQGEGIVDVTTHLVDLSMWTLFPDQVIDHRNDIDMVAAERWPTRVTRKQFARITGEENFPSYLQDQLDDDGVLPLYSNGSMVYRIRDHYAAIDVQWDYEAPEGGADTHHTTVRGTRSHLIVRQGAEQDYTATLYLKPVDQSDSREIGQALEQAVAGLQSEFPGLAVSQEGDEWRFDIPEELHLGHEAHFSLVADRFLQYLEQGSLPEWEVPNMITKYYITTRAREIALQNAH